MVLHPNQLIISLFIIEFPFQIAQFTRSTTRVKIVARAGWATIGSFVDMRCCEAKKLAHQHCVEYVKQMYCKNIYKIVSCADVTHCFSAFPGAAFLGILEGVVAFTCYPEYAVLAFTWGQTAYLGSCNCCNCI